MILDLIIAAIIIYQMVKGWKRGGIYVLGSFVVLILAFVLATQFSPLLADRIYEGTEKGGVVSKLDENLNKEIASGKDIDLSFEKLGLDPIYKEVLKNDKSGLVERWNQLAEEAKTKGKEELQATSRELAQSVIKIASQALAFLVILLLANLLLGILLRVISSLINHLPILGTANRWIGLALGFCLAVVICGALLSLIPAISGSVPELAHQSDQSKLYSLVLDSRIYREFLNFIY